MKFTKFTAFALILISIVSCKKEPTTWDTEWSAPIAYGHLTINDMIPVKYLETNSEGYLSLVIHESIFGFSLDTLIELPDTSINVKTAIGIPTLVVGPGFTLPDTYNQSYNLDEIELKSVIIESGLARAMISSPWQGKTKITITFPEVYGGFDIFERIYYLEAGSFESMSSINDIINMANYSLDLTGEDGLYYNTLGINILVESNEIESSFTVTNTDSISFTFAFEDLVPSYAKGYFGQYNFSDTMGMALPPLKKVVSGSIDLDSIDLKITVKNGFNIIGQAEISKIAGINTRTSNLVDLDFIEKGTTLNINPASGGLYDYVPSEYPIVLNNSNSNILDFLENLSDSIIVGYDLKINPFGNTTAGSDEFFPDSKMELFLDGEFPLQFGANDLVIEDTIKIDWLETTTIDPAEALVSIEYLNGFPLGALIKFYLLDESNAVIDSITSTGPINSGIYNSDSYETLPRSGTVNFTLSDLNLRNLQTTENLIISVQFNSDESEVVKISPSTFFDFKLRTNLKIRVSI